MTVYARCVGFLDEPLFGTYTLHKEYEVVAMDSVCVTSDFIIVDDDGDRTACWWDSDPDVLWERMER